MELGIGTGRGIPCLLFHFALLAAESRDRWIDADRRPAGARRRGVDGAGLRKNGAAEENTNERKTAKAKSAAAAAAIWIRQTPVKGHRSLPP